MHAHKRARTPTKTGAMYFTLTRVWIVKPLEERNHGALAAARCADQRGRRPRWIVDYSWWDVNDETLPLAPKEAMQPRLEHDPVLPLAQLLLEVCEHKLADNAPVS